MQITVEQLQGRTPLTVLRLHGDVDGSNYQDIIGRARQLHQEVGAQNLLIDLTGVPYMSSAGLVALHSIALLFRGAEPPDPEQGWRALRALADAAEAGTQMNVQLFNPQPRVVDVLQKTGLSSFFRIHTDLEKAVAAFQPN